MRRLLSCLLLCLLPVFVHAVEAPRPKIGLVLSAALPGPGPIGVLRPWKSKASTRRDCRHSMGAVLAAVRIRLQDR